MNISDAAAIVAQEVAGKTFSYEIDKEALEKALQESDIPVLGIFPDFVWNELCEARDIIPLRMTSKNTLLGDVTGFTHCLSTHAYANVKRNYTASPSTNILKSAWIATRALGSVFLIYAATDLGKIIAEHTLSIIFSVLIISLIALLFIGALIQERRRKDVLVKQKIKDVLDTYMESVDSQRFQIINRIFCSNDESNACTLSTPELVIKDTHVQEFIGESYTSCTLYKDLDDIVLNEDFFHRMHPEEERKPRIIGDESRKDALIVTVAHGNAIAVIYVHETELSMDEETVRHITKSAIEEETATD